MRRPGTPLTLLPDLPLEADVVVVGSGAAGLVAACRTADFGCRVVVLEKAALLGGTSAAGGGVMWAPANPLMLRAGLPDSREQGRAYLRSVTASAMPDDEVEWYLATCADLVGWLEAETRVDYRPLPRPDYHLGADGSVTGRGLDLEPYDASSVPGLPEVLRPPTYFPLLTMAERDALAGSNPDPDLLAGRAADGVRTMGGALVAALVHSALDRGVLIVAGARVTGLEPTTFGGWEVLVGESARLLASDVVLASGGFEWSPDLQRHHLVAPMVPISAPSNEGDGLRLAVALGATLRDAGAVWGVPVICPPGQEYDGRPGGRMGNVELTLPGALMVDRTGRRFANEALNYHDLCRALAAVDANGRPRHTPAWLVFDERYRQRYPVAGTAPGEPAWWTVAPTLRELAEATGVDVDALEATVARFNEHASRGEDPDFGRGSSEEDRHLGDPGQTPNPCLAPLDQPPFHAVPVYPGTLGTAGGLAVDLEGRVMRADGTPLPHLYAAGNVSATAFHDAYPGGGATLGSAMTRAFAVATTMTKD